MPNPNEVLPDFITRSDTKEHSVVSAKDDEHVSVVFHDNAKARELFGQYDENLAILERDLNLEATARGNEVHLIGDKTAIKQARLVLDTLYERIQEGQALAETAECSVVSERVIKSGNTSFGFGKKGRLLI